MAKTVIAVTGRTIDEFETNFDAALASILNARIDIVSFTLTELTRLRGFEFRAIITTDDSLAATITQPYQARLFQGRSASDAASEANSFYTTNPTYFTAPPVMVQTSQVRLSEQTFLLMVYNTTLADGAANWSGGTGGNTGQASGDLAGTMPTPTVEGIQGRDIDNTATNSGDLLVFNGSGITWVPEVLAFATPGDATAAAPFVDGRRVIITTGGSAGLYQVVTNGGVTFPGDYTLLSTAVVVAADWNVVDVDGLIQGVDGETVCRELVAPPSTTVVATPSTLTKDQHVTIVDLAVAGASTINLPAAPVSDERHVILDGKGDAATNSITVDGNGNTIAGETTYLIAQNYGAVTVQWDSVAGEWKILHAYLEQPRVKQRILYTGGTLDSPVGTDWKVGEPAGLGADANNPALLTRCFDDTTEEGAGLQTVVPIGATTVRFRLRSRAANAPGAPATVQPRFFWREFADNTAPTAWDAGTLFTPIDIPTNEHFQADEEEFDIPTLGITPGSLLQIEITRKAGDANDTLSGDWCIATLELEFI